MSCENFARVPRTAATSRSPGSSWSPSASCHFCLDFSFTIAPFGLLRCPRGNPIASGARNHRHYGAAVRVLVIDNYDSFTYNLVQYLGELGADVEVVRNDHATVDELLIRGYDRVIVSPGPCTPNEAGISVEAMRRFPVAKVPTLGVCLGHQALVQAWGGKVVQHAPV